MLSEKRLRRKKRIRAKVVGRPERPRLSVFRSTRFIYAQVINDEKGITLVSYSDKNLETKSKLNKTDKARLVGEKIGELCLKVKINFVTFDRSGYKYHGRVKALAEGARKGGLKF